MVRAFNKGMTVHVRCVCVCERVNDAYVILITFLANMLMSIDGNRIDWAQYGSDSCGIEKNDLMSYNLWVGVCVIGIVQLNRARVCQLFEPIF